VDGTKESSSLIRDRAVRLFTFLRELALLKTQVVRDLSTYEKVLWLKDIPEHKGCFSILNSSSDGSDESVWLEVRRPVEPKRPPSPSSCLKWIEDIPKADLLTQPQLKEEMRVGNTLNPDANSERQAQSQPLSEHFERLADHLEVVREWEHHLNTSWIPWSETYRSWKAADEFYLALFSIHQLQKKLGERYELVLGLGLLTWETPNNQIIRRHIIVGDGYLTFDADRAKFEVQAAPEGVKLRLETEMVEQRYLPSLDQQKKIEEWLILVRESPWNKDEIDRVLRSWIQSVSPHGAYSDSLVPPQKCASNPIVTFAPALILRQRTQRSQVQCFATIAELIQKGGKIPLGVQLLCEKAENIPSANQTVS